MNYMRPDKSYPKDSIQYNNYYCGSITLDRHCKNNGGPNLWIRVKITPLFLKIHLSLLEQSFGG